MATAGAAPVLVGVVGAVVAAGTPATMAYLDYSKAQDLSAMAAATVLPGTDLVLEAQVDAKKSEAIAEVIKAAVAAFTLGGPLIKTVSITMRLIRIGNLAAAEQTTLLGEAISRLGVMRTATVSNLTLKEMLAKVGAASEAGALVQKSLNELLGKQVTDLGADKVRALGMTSGKDRVPIELWRCAPEDRALFTALLGPDRYAEESAIVDKLKSTHPELADIARISSRSDGIHIRTDTRN
jgi:hypothetical protein